MTFSTRASVVLSLLLVTAGCLGGTAAGPESSPETVSGTATPTPDPTVTETSTAETASVSTEGASERPDHDKAVRLENAWNQSVEIRIRVVREATNETVHEGTYTLEPGEEREVYNVAEADPDGIEPFRVIASARNTTESVTIETHECHGGVHVEVTEDGTLYPYYPIC